MLLVKTKIGQSDISGIGLFADEFISKGTVIWKFQSGFDLKLDPSELDHLSAPAKEQFLNYAYLNSEINKYILCFDDARFFNHAEDPNCVEAASSEEDTERIDVAVKNIQKGEELTCSYKTFDADFDQKMG